MTNPSVARRFNPMLRMFYVDETVDDAKKGDDNQK